MFKKRLKEPLDRTVGMSYIILTKSGGCRVYPKLSKKIPQVKVLQLFSCYTLCHTLVFLTTCLPVLMHFDSGPFRDCLAAQEAGHSTSGMYLIRPDEAERPVQAWCEQDIDNGGWTVIQCRRDGSVNFFRNWDNYKVMTYDTSSALSVLFLSLLS